MNSNPTPLTEKVCRKCGIPQPLERFPFRKAEQTYRGTCKACRAAESRALRRNPEHAERIREAERLRSAGRKPYLKHWAHTHRENLRPGWKQRSARYRAKLKRTAYRPMLKPFRTILPPTPLTLSFPKLARSPGAKRRALMNGRGQPAPQ